MAQQSDEWWVVVGHAFSNHVRDENYVLEEYSKLAEATVDPGTRFLLELIIADERRHHALFERLGADVRDSIAAGAESQVPPPPTPPVEERQALLEQTARFLELEREDATSLKELSRELRPVRDDTLWLLLVEMMRLDTEKHLLILSYLQRRLEALGS